MVRLSKRCWTTGISRARFWNWSARTDLATSISSFGVIIGVINRGNQAAREFATVLTRGEQVDALEDLAAELQVRADDLRTAMREGASGPPVEMTASEVVQRVRDAMDEDGEGA